MAKTNLKGTMSLEEENTQNACFYNGSKLLLYDEIKGEPLVSYEDRYEKYYQPITQQDINHVIKKYFMKKNMTLCVLSNKRPHIKTIKDICNKIR
jgi:predicted Zn-dependent peptidase